MNKFIMLVGLPRTGKSSYAKLCRLNDSNTVVVSYDVLEVQEYGYLRRLTENKSNCIVNKAKQQIVENLNKGRTVIYDELNITKKGREDIISYVKENVENVEIDCVYFKKRFASSYWMFNGFDNFEPPHTSEGFDNIERR